MEAFVAPIIDVEPLNELLLDDKGFMRALPASVLSSIHRVTLAQWCQARSRYNVPSLELVDYLRELIAGRPALEIGAGMGDLGNLLGIRMTDSYIQVEDPDLRAYYARLGTPVVAPPSCVEKLSALAAVKKYRPKVVIAAWVTQLYKEGDEGPVAIGSSIYGVDEQKLLSMVDTYVHIGNLCVHGDKRIREKDHLELHLPFLFSRSLRPELNVLQVWKRK